MNRISRMLDKLEANDKIILNAAIVAGIVFISTLSTSGYPPTIDDFYSAFMGFSLALLTQLKTVTSGNEPPKMGMLL